MPNNSNDSAQIQKASLPKVQSETQEYTVLHQQRHRLLPRAVLVGLQSFDGSLMCIVEGGREVVPTASTRLESFLKVTVVSAPEASAGLNILRYGCKSNEAQHVKWARNAGK